MVLIGQLLDRAFHQFFAPTRWSIGLGKNTHHLTVVIYERLKVNRSKIRCAGKGDTQPGITRGLKCHEVSDLLAVQFFQFLANTLAFQGREIVNKEFAIQVVQFVLYADSQ